MATSIDDRIAELKREASGRRGRDKGFIVLTVGLCATVLVPWLLGKFVLRDSFFRGRGSGVYDVKVREDGLYFMSDWLMGCAIFSILLGLFLILRPWSLRIGSVLFGVLAIGAAVAFFIPTSQGAWTSAEETSALSLRTTPYPFSSSFHTCGSETLLVEGTLWQVHEAQRAGTASSGCNRLAIYSGWESKGRVDLVEGEVINDIVVTPEGAVSVTTQSGNNAMNFSIFEPPKS